MPTLWSRVWILPPPKSWNEISAIGRTDVTAALQQVENELEKCFWQASLTYYRVTFRYQIDGSRSWHWTSVLLITLLWVGSADQREPHHDHPIHSDRETWSTDKPSRIRKVTSWTPVMGYPLLGLLKDTNTKNWAKLQSHWMLLDTAFKIANHRLQNTHL